MLALERIGLKRGHSYLLTNSKVFVTSLVPLDVHCVQQMILRRGFETPFAQERRIRNISC